MKSTLISIIALLLLASCSTTGKMNRGVKFDEDNRVIFVSKYYSGYEERHIGQVLRTFEKYGFTVSRNRSESTYSLEFEISATATVSVKINVLEKGINIISVTSSNAGWGTVLARPQAVASRVEAAILELDELLQEAI